MEAAPKQFKTRWFIFAWLLSSAMMFGLSYLWHGVILNDYLSIPYPMWLYFTLAACVYLVVGLILTYLYHYTQTHKMRYKGALMGSLLGFFIYLIAFVLGVAFNPDSWQHTVVDFLWQMIEQGIGGATVGFLMLFFYRMERFEQVNQ